MFTILMLNQKGGVGKTTIADELAFALERRGYSVAFVSTDPQGGSVHKLCTDPAEVETKDFQIVDTAGVLKEEVGDWCRASDLILIPMLPSTRDLEPTMRTLDVIQNSKSHAKSLLIINTYYPFGVMDRQLLEYLSAEGIPVIAKIPRAVALSQAASLEKSIAEYDKYSHAVAAIEDLTDKILEEVNTYYD